MKFFTVDAETSDPPYLTPLCTLLFLQVSWTDHRRHCDPKDKEGHSLIRTDQGPVIQTMPVRTLSTLRGIAK